MEKVDEIIEFKKNVASMKAEMEEKDDRYKRIMAEFENYKKRSAKERETLYESIISEFVSSFLTVLDNLDATQVGVNAAYEALIKAYLNLRLIPNKDLLEELINQAEM